MGTTQRLLRKRLAPQAAWVDQFRDGVAVSIVAVCCAVGVVLTVAGAAVTIAGSVR